MVDNPQSEGVTRFVVKRVGVIGLGHMGHAFAANLVEDGYQVMAYDRDPKRVAALTGARPAPRFADLAACDVVLTSLPDDDALAAVALGNEGLARVLAPGAVHISTSTVSPDISRRVAEEHARHRQGYVAAPVLGNPDFARQRKLFVLAGGARSAVGKVRPVLERLGQRLFIIGEDFGGDVRFDPDGRSWKRLTNAGDGGRLWRDCCHRAHSHRQSARRCAIGSRVRPREHHL
jgi:3-hydroxyisobutyrate dehydrogenase-like beta-hydroxyacid dehydrogenase